MLNRSRETLSNKLSLSGPGDSNCDYLLSIIRGTCVAHANNRRTTSRSGAYPESPSPKAAKWRMDEIAEVTQPYIPLPHSHYTLPQELARRNPRPGREGVIELLKMCGYYCTVPASYQLEGITKEGDRPQSIFQDTEIWKGRYNGEVVVLKILRGPRVVDSNMGKTSGVSTLNDPQWLS